jgi:hypothetical protein
LATVLQKLFSNNFLKGLNVEIKRAAGYGDSFSDRLEIAMTHASGSLLNPKLQKPPDPGWNRISINGL